MCSMVLTYGMLDVRVPRQTLERQPGLSIEHMLFRDGP